MKVEESYKILELSKGCTEEEVKRAFRKKSMQCHPDKGGSANAFRQITTARDVVIADIKTPQPKSTYGKVGRTYSYDTVRAFEEYLREVRRREFKRRALRRQKIESRKFNIRVVTTLLFFPVMLLILRAPGSMDDKMTLELFHIFGSAVTFILAEFIAESTMPIEF